MNKSMFGSMPYLPGYPPVKPELLERYLPPIPHGVVSSWLRTNIPTGSWILDPFGASPRIALEAAQTGYRVLVTANNPIIRFLLEMAADPPSPDDLKSALAELAASYVGDERIEPHIRALYNTVCARCGQTISADAFLWEHGNPAPYARIYTCPSCGDSGEHPCTAFDAAQASKFSSSGLHKARALERVVAFNDQDRIHVEQALTVYNPRALYGLLTIINKLEGLHTTSAGQKHLAALLLYAFDQANSMWRPQAQSDRRRQLTIPRHSRENNIWCALEQGVDKCSVDNAAFSNATVPVLTWPNIPSTNSGICIYEGRLVNLIDSIEDIRLNCVCTAIPRPNQAYWTLSALWAGWLWGREAVGKFKSVLHRQRYDWAWHASALASVFKQLANFLEPSTSIFGLIGEAEPGFVGSALVAAAISGCRLDSMALRPEEKQAQLMWRCEKDHELSQMGTMLTQTASQAAKLYLEQHAEPASYLSTISSALVGIITNWSSRDAAEIKERSLRQDYPGDIVHPVQPSEPTPSLIYSNTYNAAREALTYRYGFLRYNLQDETDSIVTAKSPIIQSTLFSMDVGSFTEKDDDQAIAEAPPPEGEFSAEKERSTRSSDVSESAFLWLRQTDHVSHVTSTDEYEASLVNYLINHPASTLSQIDAAVCTEYPGLFTPDADFIQLCLDSYGLRDPQDPTRWHLRPEDTPAERASDIIRVNGLIKQVGSRLGFECVERQTCPTISCVCWLMRRTNDEYWFYTTTSSSIGEMVIHAEQPPNKGFIVFPASRANLMIYRLRRDPRLSKAFHPEQGVWHFLKFRHLRSLSESPILTRENLDQLLSLDPLTFTTPQLWLV